MVTGREAEEVPGESTTGAGPGLSVGILGDVVAVRDGVRLDLGGPQQRSVLALLVLARGDVVPAERLVDALWGERPPASATSSLHSLISRLRARLDADRTGSGQPGSPGPVVVRQGTGYRLALPRDAVDAWRFERLLQSSDGPDPQERVHRLTEALGLWRGPALADHADDDWAQGEAVRLDSLREVARDQLRAARLDCGEHAVLVPELEQLVEDDPLREEHWRLLALALYRSSRQADALAALRRAREVLADQLGVDPGPALRQLEADILAHAPSLDLVPPARPVLPPRDTGPARGGGAALLVDRADEVTELDRALDDAVHGRGSLVVVEGPAGIGKTRLLAEARRMAAERGVPVAEARGSQLEHEYGFGAVRQLLEPAVQAPGGAALLSGPAAPAASVFDLAPADAAPADAFGILQGLYRLTGAVAREGPLLLAVDDLQWCDTSSLRFFAFLHRRLESLPVVLVATLRTGDPYTDDDLITELVGDPSTVLVRPAPLSADAVATVVRARLGDGAAPAFVAACHRATRGNPLLLHQLLRALEGERVPPDAAHAETVTAIGSRAVWSLVLLRLRRLPEMASSVARAVAVLGDGAELSSVAALAEVPEDEVVSSVAALSRVEILRAEYPLGFVHPLVAEAVYGSLATGERETAHERAARILDGAGAPAERVAAHLLQAPRRGSSWTVDVLTRAADQVQARGAADAAVAYLSRAVEEPAATVTMVPLLVRLGMVAGGADGPLARQSLERAYELAQEPEQRAEIALLLTGALVFLGSRGEATAFAQRAADGLPTSAVDHRQALVAVARTAGWIHLLPTDQWLGCAPLDVVGTGIGARMLAIEQAWELCVRGVDRDRAVDLVRFALDDPAWLHGAHDLFHDVAGLVLMVADQDTTLHWDGALDRARARGEVLMVGVHLWRGVNLWGEGDLWEARQSLLTARHQTEEWGSDQVGVPYCDAFLVLVSLDLGLPREARALLDEALDRPGIGDGRRLLREAEAAVLLAEGRPDEALAAVDRLLSDQAGLDNPAWFTARALRADVLLALGRPDEAVTVVDAELDAARRWGASDTLGRLLTQLASARGGPAGLTAAREAVDVLRDGRARLKYARALACLADLTPDEAVRSDLRRQAVRLADDCGAAGLRRDVAAALVASGSGVPDQPHPRATLTQVERRCVELAAAGRDTNDVARELFVTPRTVEAALASARQRLGVDTDAELAAALAD